MSIALAHNSTEVAEYTPASALVMGKTLTERKVSVLHGATFEAITYLAGQKGSVGKHARMGLVQFSVGSIATAARRGNYQPLAEAIAGLLGESVSIPNRSTFESLETRFQDKINDLALSKNGGYVIRKKDGVQVPSSKRATLTQVVELIQGVREMAAKIA